MFGSSSKKQDVNLRIETCSSSGQFQKHAEQSSKLIESWLDPKKFTLKTAINAGDPKHVAAFELWVNGNLVHSEQQRNHGYLDSHPDDEHKEAVRMAIQEIIAGHRAVMPDKQENSEIKLDNQKQQQQKDNIAMKKRELEEADKSRHRQETLKKKTEADEKKQAKKEAAKLKKAAVAKEKKQKEATSKRSAQDFRREEAQKRTEEVKEKGEPAKVEALRAQVEGQALAKASVCEELKAKTSASRKEAQKRNAEADEKATAESFRVDAQADGKRDGEVQALAKALAAVKKAAVAKEKKQKEATSNRSAEDFRREEAQKRTEEVKEKGEPARVEALRAQVDAQASAKALVCEELKAKAEASRKAAQKRNAEAEEKAKAESLRVDAQADGERDGEVQALAKALVAEETMAPIQRRFDQNHADPASINLAATLPPAADDRGASHKSLQTPHTTAGNSMNSSWEAPPGTEQKPLIQSGSKENSLATSQAVLAQPSTGLAMLFGFACCRSSSTLEDSAGDIPVAPA